MLARFDVRGCCGDLVKSVEWDVADDIANEAVANDFNGVWDEFSLANEYAGRIFDAAGIKNYKCGSCYDSAYRVHFGEFIGGNDCAGNGVRKLVVTITMAGPDSDQVDGVDDIGDLTDLISSISSGYFPGKITWERE